MLKQLTTALVLFTLRLHDMWISFQRFLQWLIVSYYVSKCRVHILVNDILHLNTNHTIDASFPSYKYRNYVDLVDGCRNYHDARSDRNGSAGSVLYSTLVRNGVPTDITYIMQMYYQCDKTLSTYSLQLWIDKFFVAEFAQVVILFTRGGKILISTIDLTENKEMTTGNECYDTDLIELMCTPLCTHTGDIISKER